MKKLENFCRKNSQIFVQKSCSESGARVRNCFLKNSDSNFAKSSFKKHKQVCNYFLNFQNIFYEFSGNFFGLLRFRREKKGFANWLTTDSFDFAEKCFQAQKVILQPIVDEKDEKDFSPNKKLKISIDGEPAECDFCEVEILPDALETFLFFDTK